MIAERRRVYSRAPCSDLSSESGWIPDACDDEN
jgi:hypothetical protein